MSGTWRGGHYGPQGCIHVQALVDAEAGLAKTGEAVFHGFRFLERLTGILQLFTSWDRVLKVGVYRPCLG